MRMQFRWHILAIILLCICLPFGLSDKNDRRNDRNAAAATGRHGKLRQPKQGIPLRDDSDYIRENEQQQFTVDDDYDDEYYEGEENDSNKKISAKQNNDENDVKQSAEIVEQAQSARTQIIQRPKELTDTELAALLNASPTPSADVSAPAAETCPKECSCLNDFMTCTRLHLKILPKVPQFIQSLYVYVSIFLHIIFFLHIFFSRFSI